MGQKVNIIVHILTFLLSIRSVRTKKTLTTVSIVSSHNYPVEAHSIETKDGYILKIFRIPNSPRFNNTDSKRPKPVFFLQHGLKCSSDMYVLNGPDNGLPFMLADAGYDVWLGNARGNRYSRRHKKLNPNKNEFWKFSWHEIGIYDMPAMFEYVLKKTFQNSLHYVGHSQGGTTLLVLMSMLPEYNFKLKTCHLLAPAAWMRDLSLPEFLTAYIKLQRDSEFLPNLSLIFIYTGKKSPHMNQTAIPLMLGTLPSGISSRQIKHYLQLKESGKFRQYDFGHATNMALYGHPKPPDYPLHNIKPYSKINIFYSLGDETTSAGDIHHLAKHLRHRQMHLIGEKNWLHLDFVLSKTVKRYINTPILIAAQKFDNTNRHNRYSIFHRYNG